MTLPVLDKFDSPQDIKEMYRRIREEITLDDLTIGNVRKEAPTLTTLGKGKTTLALISNIPTIYHHGIDGVLYKSTFVAA